MQLYIYRFNVKNKKYFVKKGFLILILIFIVFLNLFSWLLLIFIQQTMLLIQKYIFYFQNKKIHEQKKTIVMKNTFIFYNFICCVSCKCVFL